MKNKHGFYKSYYEWVVQFLVSLPFSHVTFMDCRISFVFFRRESNPVPIHLIKIEWPKISILIPCYNEQDTIEETINHFSRLSYPNKEIIAVNDGSQDSTGRQLQDLASIYLQLRVVDCSENRGKAQALQLASFASTAEFLVCVDADAIQYQAFESDLQKSITVLEDKLDISVQDFAYPYGIASDEIVSIVENSSISRAAILAPRSISPGNGLYRINRFLVEEKNFEMIFQESPDSFKN
ncbi:glycosyltransferase [Halobacillus shinanisalinarum]|uniref:Glycosyltransferase n=1 Tax=Halobacillus shinanisalinarum TaxID=2932258 RepID=A0ABY4H561_9BACI|nr:glycosyltransferase [Halobacillus shinanisalinarum]UOQ95449.1 glycosyltransferase [Halobacillus shinanisalinarum]